VRIALGAGARSVLRMVVREGLVVVAVGSAAGLLASLALTRVLRSLLFDVSPFDPITFIGVPLALFAVSVLASLIPARRASRVDPMDALRSD
jgi:ABC-type antimicrobial peptide transport system permease subunit